MNLCQDIFQFPYFLGGRAQKYYDPEKAVWRNYAVAGYDYFQNPLFIHDARLNVISCPIWREGSDQLGRRIKIQDC